eukprot:3929388-Lingulodinium_polyedra.AAC.1
MTAAAVCSWLEATFKRSSAACAVHSEPPALLVAFHLICRDGLALLPSLTRVGASKPVGRARFLRA